MDLKRFKPKGIVADFIQSMWLPVVWAGLLVIHIVMVSSDPEPSILFDIFDRLIMFSCFLLYPIQALQWEEWQNSYLPFAMQFLFWWLISYGALILYRYLKRRFTRTDF